MPKEAADKIITLDDLAVMLKRQFDVIDDRFCKIDEQYFHLDKMVNKKFEEVNKRFDQLESTMATKADIKRLERRLEPLEDIVLKEHSVRIRVLEKAILT